MHFHDRTSLLALLPARLRGMFNLNDPRWGRGEGNDGKAEGQPKPDAEPERPPSPPPAPPTGPGYGQPGRGGAPTPGQPPDLDELWRDLNRKLGSLFGGGNGPRRGGDGGGLQQPDMKNAGAGLGLIAVIAALIWLGTGFFIVQEGQQAVITQFGKYKSTVNAGFNWRLPYPIQRHELVFVTQIRSVDVGRDRIIESTGLRESAMLTEDENIVEIKFVVQYRLNDARAWLFESRDPAGAVVQAAETAVREVVGKMQMDTALAEERDQIAPRVRTLMQTILDRYKVGVEVVSIQLQEGGVRPPEQVQAAFDDVLKAGQERERAKNEAQAYANDVVPRAIGSASRLMEEASAYKERIVAQAQGDAQRFEAILAEYQKAPQVTRERLYLESMEQIYGNVTKILVESRQGSNLLYLPLDKIMQGNLQSPASNARMDVSNASNARLPATPAFTGETAPRIVRDTNRARERETR